MSVPRCVWASKMSAPSGSSRRISSSHCAISSWARCSASFTLRSLCRRARAAPSPLASIRPVPDVLIYGDTIRSPELRHEVPLAIPDPFLYLEHDGRRVVAIHSLEIPRVREHAHLEILPTAKLGEDELIASGKPEREITLELALRACRELGIERAAVPPTFPVEHADHLRANGIELEVGSDLFDNRRRAKSETELSGIRNAQKACEAALDAARELLRSTKA